MAAPSVMDTVLKQSPIEIGAYVPDDLLEDRFVPGTGINLPSEEALAAAKSYGSRFECEFNHYRDRKEVFWKWEPAL